MRKQLQKLKSQLKKLGNSSVEIAAKGNYPKSETKVQDVAVYQNDGTATISPSQFVERAAAIAGDWNEDIKRAVIRFINGDNSALDKLGSRVARGISKMCDRVDTGRLKASFRSEVKNGS